MIAVQKLDGEMMHLNEELIERVESASGGQSAVYLRTGGHVIVANDPDTVVGLIRAEKVAILREAFEGPSSLARSSAPLSLMHEATAVKRAREE